MMGREEVVVSCWDFKLMQIEEVFCSNTLPSTPPLPYLPFPSLPTPPSLFPLTPISARSPSRLIIPYLCIILPGEVKYLGPLFHGGKERV